MYKLERLFDSIVNEPHQYLSDNLPTMDDLDLINFSHLLLTPDALGNDVIKSVVKFDDELVLKLVRNTNFNIDEDIEDEIGLLSYILFNYQFSLDTIKQLVCTNDKISYLIHRQKCLTPDYLDELWNSSVEFNSSFFLGNFSTFEELEPFMKCECIKRQFDSIHLLLLHRFQLTQKQIKKYKIPSLPSTKVSGNYISRFRPCDDGLERYKKHTDLMETIELGDLLKKHYNQNYIDIDGENLTYSDLNWLLTNTHVLFKI